MKRPYTDDSTGSREESPLARRLAERSATPGMIDVKAAETRCGRTAGWLMQRTRLLDRLRSRSRNSESLAMGNDRLVFSGADRHDPSEPPLVASGFFASPFQGPDPDAGASRQTAGTLPDTRTAGKASIQDSGPDRAVATRTDRLVQRSQSSGAIDVNPVLRRHDRIGEPAARRSFLIDRLQSRGRSPGSEPEQKRAPIAVGRRPAEEVPETVTDEMNRSQKTTGAGHLRHDLPAADPAVSRPLAQTSAFPENTSRQPIQTVSSSKAVSIADAARDRTSGTLPSAAPGPNRPSTVKGYRISRRKPSGTDAGSSFDSSSSLMMSANGTLSVTRASDSGKMAPVTRNTDSVRRASSKKEPQNRQEQNHADELIRKISEPEKMTPAARKNSQAASGPYKKVQPLTAAAVTDRRHVSGKSVLLKPVKKTARTEKQSVQRSSDDRKDDCGTGRRSSTGPANKTVKTAAPEIQSARTSAAMIVGRKGGQKEALKGHDPAMDQKRIEKGGREESKFPDVLIQKSEQPTVKEAAIARVIDPGSTSSITAATTTVKAGRSQDTATVDKNSGESKKRTAMSSFSGVNNRAFARISKQDALHRALSRFSLKGTPTAETAAMRKQAGERAVNAEQFIESITGFINSATGSPELSAETTPARKPAIVWRKTIDSALTRNLFSPGAREGKNDSFSPISNGSPGTVLRQASGDVSGSSPESGVLSQNEGVSSAGQATEQKTDLDLELLAEQVSYLISRRLAVEHERRGVGI